MVRFAMVVRTQAHDVVRDIRPAVGKTMDVMDFNEPIPSPIDK